MGVNFENKYSFRDKSFDFVHKSWIKIYDFCVQNCDYFYDLLLNGYFFQIYPIW